jgi:hypothetical protein
MVQAGMLFYFPDDSKVCCVFQKIALKILQAIFFSLSHARIVNCDPLLNIWQSTPNSTHVLFMKDIVAIRSPIVENTGPQRSPFIKCDLDGGSLVMLDLDKAVIEQACQILFLNNFLACDKLMGFYNSSSKLIVLSQLAKKSQGFCQSPPFPPPPHPPTVFHTHPFQLRSTQSSSPTRTSQIARTFMSAPRIPF